MTRKFFNFQYILGAALLIFTPLFLKYPLFYLPGIPTPIRLDDFVFGFIIFLWMIWVLMNNKNPFYKNPLNIPILIYLYSLIFSTAFGLIQGTINLSGATLFLGRNLEFILIFYLVYSIFDFSNLKSYLKIIFGTAFFVIFISFLQIIKFIPQDFTPGATRFATFSASYDYGAYLMMVTFLIYSLLFANKAGFTGGMKWLIFIAMLFALLNSDSRVSLSAFIIILVFSIFITGRKRPLFIVGVILISTPFLVFTEKIQKFLNVFIKSGGSLIQVIKADPSLAIRFENWNRVIEQWLKYPLFGGGLSSFLSYIDILGFRGAPDSWYLRVLAEGGIIGLLTFGLLIFFILRIEYKVFKNNPDSFKKYFALGTFLMTLALLINAIFVDIFVAIKIGIYFWILVAMVAKLYYETFHLRHLLSTQTNKNRVPKAI